MNKELELQKAIEKVREERKLLAKWEALQKKYPEQCEYIVNLKMKQEIQDFQDDLTAMFDRAIIRCQAEKIVNEEEKKNEKSSNTEANEMHK